MKIAACAICKDEEENISKWLGHTKDFDYRIVVDTGSTDRSMELLSKSDVILAQKKFESFRFDEARNFVMTLIPNDVDWCIWPDFDEHYCGNWRQDLENTIRTNPSVTRLTYKTFLIRDGIEKEGLESGAITDSKIHRNKLYKWEKPIHEYLSYIGEGNETIKQVDSIQRFHKQDVSKERVTQHFEIAKSAVETDPKDAYNLWFVLKGYYFTFRDVDNSIKYAKRYLDITKPYTNFRSHALQILADCEAKKYGITPNTTLTLLRSVSENPQNIEVWRGLVNTSFKLEDWHMVLFATSVLKDSNLQLEAPYKIALNKIKTNETP